MTGIIDAHLHLWTLATGDYRWNTAELGPAHADFGAHDAVTALDSAGVDHAILVQAADTVGDSERMLAIAEASPRFAGVVAWLPLEHPDLAERQLDAWTGRPVIGIRQLVHDHHDPALLDDERVRATIRLVGERGLPLDIPDAWPRLWPAVSRLVRDSPGLTVVLDHLGKPALGRLAHGSVEYREQVRLWERELHELAASPNVTAKLSGLGALLAEGETVGAEAVRPFVEIALSAFGPDRLMFGSDWPMSLAGGSYAAVVEATVASLSTTELDSVLAGTARRTYGIRATA